MKKKECLMCLACVLLFTCIGAVTLTAQEEEIIEEAREIPLLLQARLYNQKRYTPQSEIIVEIRLANVGTGLLTIILEPKFAEHISYVVTDQSGATPPPTPIVLLGTDPQSKTPARVASLAEEEEGLAREVTLGSGEALLLRDVISNKYRFARGSYQLTVNATLIEPDVRLQAPSVRFTVFSDYYSQAATEEMSMIVEESIVGGDEPSEMEKEEMIEGRMEERLLLNPDTVVKRMLAALQGERWEELYSYLNLIVLYREDPDRNQLYVNGNVATQQQLIDQFRELIQSQNSPLFRVPLEYKIVHTEYSDVLAVVRAEILIPLAEREKITESYELTYRLQGGEGAWEIYSVSATKTR